MLSSSGGSLSARHGATGTLSGAGRSGGSSAVGSGSGCAGTIMYYEGGRTGSTSAAAAGAGGGYDDGIGDDDDGGGMGDMPDDLDDDLDL